jgi:glycine/D-amino acid oxidase-like deaminating enzyme
MPLRFGSPFWLAHDRSRRIPQYPRQRGRLEVDVAIVGGGFTGCLIAYVFATAGIRVAVLERGRIGYGSAGASTALLMQEPDRYLTQLTSLYGHATARTIWRLSKRAVRDLIRILEPMNCGLRPVSSLHVATNPAGARDLRRDVRARHAAGLGGRLLHRDGLERRTGMRGRGAILLSGDAVVDPYRATVALARAARRAGARIFEHSDVATVHGGLHGAVVATGRGRIDCTDAVIATGFATPAFEPLQAHFTMSTTYVIATDPIAPRDRAAMGKGRIMFWDAERPYHYFRWTDDGRILFGGEDRPVPSTQRARRSALIKSAKALQRKLLEFYPQLERPGIAYAWDGMFASTPDGLPYIGPHARYPRQLFALGYGGNGMTFASLAARVLLRYYRGRSIESDRLFGFER